MFMLVTSVVKNVAIRDVCTHTLHYYTHSATLHSRYYSNTLIELQLLLVHTLLISKPC